MELHIVYLNLDFMENLATNSNIVLNMVLKAAEKLGLKVDELLQLLPKGIDQEVSESIRFSTIHIPQVWQWFENQTDDPNIGFRLAQTVPISSQSVLSYLFMSCQTLGKALTQFIQYQELIGDCCNLALEKKGNLCHLHFELGIIENDIIRQENEYGTLLIFNWFKLLFSEQLDISSVHFNHKQPADITEHLKLFNCDIIFNSDKTYIVFEEKLLDLPIKFSNSSMNHLVEQQVQSLLTQLKIVKLVSYVESLIREELYSGEVNINNIAKQCNVTERQLQLQLSKYNTSFSELLEQEKQKKAVELLASPNNTIGEISDACGFSESSTFNRAFKRWFAMTPSQYRKNIQIS